MVAKHTPGPWKALPEECDRPYIRIRGTIPGARYKVANVLTPVYEGVDSREAEETRANANLIAAAPYLLSALRGMVDAHAIPSTACKERNTYEEALAAIAKATGEPA